MDKATLTKLPSKNHKLMAVCLTFLVAFTLVLLFRANFAAVDFKVNLWVLSIQSSSLTDLGLGVSYVFDTYSLLAASLVVATILFLKNYRGQSLLLLGAMGGDAVLVATFKTLVHSPRPTNMIGADSGFSFPSGHTIGSLVFCGVLTFFAWQHWKTTKPIILLAIFAVTTVSIVGFDRLYLNAHWFSDVFGGFMLGICWLSFVTLIFIGLNEKGRFQTERFNSISGVLFGLGVIVALGIFSTQWFPPQMWIDATVSFFQALTNTVNLITTVGYIGLFIVVFAESGLFAGFFLPGDSLLFTAGILASQNLFDITIIIAAVIAGAILGDSFGYAFGRKVGPMFVKRNSRFLSKDKVAQVQAFYERHGSKAVLLARFVPVGRTFAPILAGASKMNYRTFLSYNVLGGLLWGLTLPLLGFYIGQAIPDIQLFLYPIIMIIVLISVLPWIATFVTKRWRQKQPPQK